MNAAMHWLIKDTRYDTMGAINAVTQPPLVLRSNFCFLPNTSFLLART